jgi:hypothetical protein
MKNAISPEIKKIVRSVENKIIVNRREPVNRIEIVKKKIKNAETVKMAKTVKLG